jgi:hypothetical protein
MTRIYRQIVANCRRVDVLVNNALRALVKLLEPWVALPYWLATTGCRLNRLKNAQEMSL